MTTPLNWQETDAVSAEKLDLMEQNTLNTSTGHDHNGSNSKSLVILPDEIVGASKLASTVSFKTAITGYLSLAAECFGGFNGTDCSNKNVDVNGGLFAVNSTHNFNININPPNGAKITKLSMYASANGANTTVSLYLYKRTINGSTTSTVSSIALSGAGATLVESGALNDIVDKNTYCYFLSANLIGGAVNAVIYAAKVTYTITKPQAI